MLAVAYTIINRNEITLSGGYDFSYYGDVTYDGKYHVSNRVDTPDTLRNVCLSPVQYTGLTGSKEDANCGGEEALKPKTNTEKWKRAVRIAKQMLNNPSSIKTDLEKRLGVPVGYKLTSYRSTSIYSFNKDKSIATTDDGKKLYVNVDYVIYGGNLYFLKKE
jgi:hypothetical protein